MSGRLRRPVAMVEEDLPACGASGEHGCSCICMCMCVCVRARVHVYVCVCVCEGGCVCVLSTGCCLPSIYPSIYPSSYRHANNCGLAHTHAHTHTHSHTHIHTHTHPAALPLAVGGDAGQLPGEKVVQLLEGGWGQLSGAQLCVVWGVGAFVRCGVIWGGLRGRCALCLTLTLPLLSNLSSTLCNAPARSQ